MINKLFFAALLIMICSIAAAQRFDGGILAGFNASQVEGDIYRGYHKPGLLGGFYIETDLAPAVFMGMEIKYSQKGSRKKVTEKDPDKYIMRLGYVDVPVYAAFRTNQRGAVLAGVSTGFLVHSKEMDNYGEFPEEDQNAFNTIDLQPFLGFQFDFLDNLKVDLRFALSVLPIRGRQGEDGTNYYWQNNQFNNVISLAGYYQIGR